MRSTFLKVWYLLDGKACCKTCDLGPARPIYDMADVVADDCGDTVFFAYRWMKQVVKNLADAGHRVEVYKMAVYTD